MTTAFPSTFGRYLLIDRLASGGMAEIFRAKLVGVEGFEKTVVIKRIHPFWSERRDFITMLVDEAKLLVHLNHPNIVQVFELGREGETYFIAMEFVEGVDLRQLQQKLKAAGRPLPPELALFIVLEALKGLHYAHERSLKDRGRLGIVHRDVSPQNILLSFEGEVKVTDFGIAKALTQTHETQTGVLKGKYAYMSPEQALGAPLDARSDLFACGIVLWELLFERRLFAGKTDIETLDRVRRAEIPFPEDRPLYPGLREVLEQALRLRPEDRFASAEEFAEALEACLPRERKAGRRQFAAFLEEVFAAEIQDRRQHVEEMRQKTESFLRHTRVGPAEGERTVSLVEEGPTELEAGTTSEADFLDGRPAPAPKVSENARPKPFRNWAWALPILVLSIVLGLWLLNRRQAPPVPASVVGSVQVLSEAPKPTQNSPLPESRPVAQAALPTPSPAAVSGPLLLKALPASALLRASHPGGKEQGTGALRLAGLSPNAAVTVSASLAGYEPQSKTFTIAADPSPQEYVFQLEKKAPGFGSVRVNAAPWGRVSMPGFIAGAETPVVRGKIPEGRYAVSVSNSALRKTLSATAVVRAGKTTQCHADFEGRGGMSCR
ncbi:MAG: protein kinase [bacterium]